MRRENRKENIKKTNDNILTYCIIASAILILAIIWIMSYLGKKEESDKYADLENNKLNNITNTSGNTESASTEIGKSVNEVINSNTSTNNTLTNSTTTNQINNSTNETTNKSYKSTNTIKTSPTTKTSSTTKNSESKPIEKSSELSFIKPIDGKISKDFAKDQLIYSDTLKEWTSHLGIDITANENSDVVSVEAGTIKSIKNDPRYGVTITVEHGNGFQSIYSNLQTSEMVVEGEQVEKGQTIATVGNTASFESKDEPHLHFELLKDLKQVNPNEYIK